MAKRIKLTEAGQGGKKGHSQMTHWRKTGEIKDGMRKLRRRQAREEIREQTS